MNNVCVLGNITKDLELKETTSGVKYVRFSIAVRRNYKNEVGEYDTDFFNVVAWRKTAEFISEYFGKGKRIGIIGRLQNSKYTDSEGVERTSTEIIANDVQIVEKKSSESNSTQEEEATDSEAENGVIEQDIFKEFGDSLEIDEDIAF